MQMSGDPIESIVDFLNRIKEVYTDKELLWFRGQAKDYEKLMPKLLRSDHGLELEESLYYRFQAKAIPMLDKVPNTYFEWLFVMQHYGVPTRLLDWTTDALTALAFAVTSRDESHRDDHAVIYCLEPYKLNNEFNEMYDKPSKLIPNIIMNEIHKNFSFDSQNHYRWPIACIGPLNNSRIVAQKGVFTLSPVRTKNYSLKGLDHSSGFLTSIEVHKDFIDEIITELAMLGIRENSLYPSLENLSNEINKEFKL
ncbi:FRG domain-containing protein [Jeotgalibacillus sp. S-D1]|uniref:FRG domain-containing protein n=1 Tax=Jeotgalibacillus sp. S-D1 TaxID=2552189 RepID=UPI0014045B51|nr:FRG domain-containing protein [Jeotgalibacillus sp. S-D1]